MAAPVNGKAVLYVLCGWRLILIAYAGNARRKFKNFWRLGRLNDDRKKINFPTALPVQQTHNRGGSFSAHNPTHLD